MNDVFGAYREQNNLQSPPGSDLFFSIPLGFNGAQREMCATRRRDNQRNVTKYCCYFFV